MTNTQTNQEFLVSKIVETVDAYNAGTITKEEADRTITIFTQTLSVIMKETV